MAWSAMSHAIRLDTAGDRRPPNVARDNASNHLVASIAEVPLRLAWAQREELYHGTMPKEPNSLYRMNTKLKHHFPN